MANAPALYLGSTLALDGAGASAVIVGTKTSPLHPG
jgi:hypothetical protein